MLAVAAERTQPGTSARTGVVWEVLSAGLARQAERRGQATLDVVDLGGGTGGFAVPLARLGHRVTVVDPSPDALVSLERRAAEDGVSERVRAVQGDLGSVFDAVAKESADAVLCHGVLEVADDPVEGMGAARRSLAGPWSKLEGFCLRIALILSRLEQAGVVIPDSLRVPRHLGPVVSGSRA